MNTKITYIPKRVLFSLFFLIVFLWSGNTVHAAAITSAQSGDWNSTSTWTGGAIPGSGDTATIASGHTVTITSGNPVTLGTSGATGSAALTINGTTGQLVINADLTLSGDLVQQNGTTVTVGPGVTIGWNMPTGSSYQWNRANTSTGAGTININGTANSRVTIKKLSGATNDNINISLNLFTQHVLNWNYVTIDGLGSASVASLTASGSSQKFTFNWTGILFKDSGQLLISNSNATSVFNIAGLDFRSVKNTTFINWTNTAVFTSGTRTISGLTYYSTSTKGTAQFNVRGYTISGALYNTLLSFAASSRDNVIDGLASFMDLNSPAGFMSTQGRVNLTLRNSFLGIVSNIVNSHSIAEGGLGSISANIYEDNVMTGEDTNSDDDDGILMAGLATVQRNLFIKNFGAINTALPLTNTVTFLHNTIDTNSSGAHSYGIVIGELSGDSADALGDVKDNIFSARAGITGHKSGLDIRAANFSPQNNFVLSNNVWDNSGNDFSTNKVTMKNSTSGTRGYIETPDDGSNRRAAATTLQPGTTATNLVATGSPWSSVVVGDIVWVALKGHGIITAVTDANNISIDSATFVSTQGNFASGDSAVILKRVWNSTSTYGASGKGESDIETAPNFVDPDRNMISFDIANGGVGTRINVIKKFVSMNGIDETGSTAVFDSNYSTSNIVSYYRAGYAPQNSALDGTASDGGDIGAVNVVLSDTTPPVRSAGAPSGSLSSGTTSTNISLTTDEAATCKYGTSASVAYASMASTFVTTGGTSHSTSISSLSDGNSYTYYVRCIDASTNANTTDYSISFSVDPTPSTTNTSTEIRSRSRGTARPTEQINLCSGSPVIAKNTATLEQRLFSNSCVIPTGWMVIFTPTTTTQTQTIPTLSQYLYFGSENSQVVLLQSFLKSKGFLSSTAPSSGYFGELTKAALQRYQQSRNIEPTGTAGPLTRASVNAELLLNPSSTTTIVSSESVPPNSIFRTLRRGMTGDDIVSLQLLLKALRYFNIDTSPSFGPITEKAVKDFQIAEGITADGVVDLKTMDRIRMRSRE